MTLLRTALDLLRSSRRWADSRLPLPWSGPGVFGRSLDIRHVDSGSCNACELELHALAGPAYDISRLGIAFVASPRHADALLLTGPVTRNLEEAVRLTVEATPRPRAVIACGDCACGCGPFAGSYAVAGSPEAVVGIDARILGCPPEPQAIMDALAQLRGELS